MKTGKRIKELMGRKEHVLLISFTITTAIIMFLIQHYTVGLTKDFWLSLVPNVIVDMLGILITSYIIAYLLQRSEEKKAKEKAYKITGGSFSSLIRNIGTNYVHLITRKPYGHKGNDQEQELKDKLIEVNSKIEELMPPDFIHHKIEKSYITPERNSIRIEERLLEYRHFCKSFKTENEQYFEKFITRYIGFLPDDLRESLLNVEMLLHSKILVTPLDFGMDMEFEVNYEEYINYIKILGEELIFLIDYFKEFKER